MLERPLPSAGEVRALAHQLLQWADRLTTRPAAVMSEQDQHELTLRLAEAMQSVSRLRERIFPRAALGNPNWDVMVDLFVRELNGYRTSLDQAVIADEMPIGTVRRSVEKLSAQGLVTLSPDRSDNGTIWLALSEKGKQGMFELLQETSAAVGVHPLDTAA